ncbi:receptor-like serine/threonine-protein kinase NCRK, partial [Tanacetum coccineum]
MKNRFGPSKYEDPKGALSKLLQLGTVEDYQREFEELMNLVMDIPDSLLISYYIYRLKRHLQRELLVSKPTTLGDVFSLARIIEARFDDQEAPVAGTLAGLEANKVVNDGDDSESLGPVTPTSNSKSSGEVLVDGKQDEAKVVKVMVVAVEQNIDEPDVEGNGVIGVGVNENNKGVQYSVSTLHVLILLLERLNDQYIKKKKMEAAIQRRIWDPGIKIIFLDNTLRTSDVVVLVGTSQKNNVESENRMKWCLVFVMSVLRKYDKQRKEWETVGRLPERADSMNGWGLAFGVVVQMKFHGLLNKWTCACHTKCSNKFPFQPTALHPVIAALALSIFRKQTRTVQGIITSFSYAKLETATNKFYDSNLIGVEITYLGMAKSLVSDGILSCSSSPACMQGTFGYFAPEYAIMGRALLMSDVFSFGVVLLELISGRHRIYKSPDKGEESIIIWDNRRVSKELPNPCLKGNFKEEELQVMAYLAKECLLLDHDACPIIIIEENDKDPIRESESPESLKQVIFPTSNPKSSHAEDDEVIADLTEPR